MSSDIDSQYISSDQFEKVLKPLNIALNSEDAQELLDRATADLEAELVKRFVVPLQGASSAYAKAAPYSVNVVVTALKSKIKSLAGIDKNRNIVLEQGQRFVDLHKGEFDSRMKLLLDPHRKFDFLLQPQAQDAMDPVQDIGGLARADNRLEREPDWDAL